MWPNNNPRTESLMSCCNELYVPTGKMCCDRMAGCPLAGMKNRNAKFLSNSILSYFLLLHVFIILIFVPNLINSV